MSRPHSAHSRPPSVFSVFSRGQQNAPRSLTTAMPPSTSAPEVATADGGATTSGGTDAAGPSTTTTVSTTARNAAAAAALVVGVPAAMAAAWWVAEKGFNSVTPYQVRREREREGEGGRWGGERRTRSRPPPAASHQKPTLASSSTLPHPLLQYHYRPGTISAYFSRLLARHADRRRSEF